MNETMNDDIAAGVFQILSEKEREINNEMLMMMENGGSRLISPVGYH